MRIFFTFIILFFGFINFCYSSSEPKFSILSRTPTKLRVPSNLDFYIVYTVKNNTTITRTLTMRPIPGIEQVTSDNSFCPNPFTLSPGESCVLTLKRIDNTLNYSYTGGPVICKTQTNTNIPDPFLCSQPEQSMILSIKNMPSVPTNIPKLYVSNWDGQTVSLCYINEGKLTNCHVTGVSDTFKNPEAIAMYGNYLFVANIGGGISSCTIDATTGGLSACGTATSDPIAPIYAPDGIAIQSGLAYISNSGPETSNQGVTVCSVNGGTLSNCSFTQGDASFAVPSDLALLNDTIYVTNFQSSQLKTTWCTVQSHLCVTGNEGIISGTGNLLNNPEGLYFANIASQNYAYFTNHGNNTVVFCTVSSPASFTGCIKTNGFFYGYGNLVIDTYLLKAFVPSGNKTIGICDVANDGSLSNCINSTEDFFNGPSGLLIN